MSLCYRCENRAIAHETRNGPRYECTDFERLVSTCYCFEPVKPPILKRVKGDKREQFAPRMISARSSFNGLPTDLKLVIRDYGRKGKAAIWTVIE